MQNIPKIQTNLYGLVGFQQPLNPDYDVIDAGNLASRSGYFVTDNEFVKVEYIKDGQDYEALTDGEFNTFLENKQKSSIANVANLVFNTPDSIDRGLYYKYAQNKIDTVTLPIGFVGYRLNVDLTKNIAVSIKRVLLDFSGTGSFDLLLWNTGKKATIESKTITITTDHQEEVLDWVIDNTEGIYKGDFYIGYNTTGLGVTPFKREYENASVPSVFKFLEIFAIQVAGHNSTTLFDLDDQDGMSDANGLNFDFTVYEDYTDLMINNEMLFANAINIDFQISLLSIGPASLRSNRNERISESLANKILVELEGAENETIKKVGLRTKLMGAITQLRTEINKLKVGYFGERLFVETLD